MASDIMVEGVMLVSTVVMGVLLFGVAFALVRAQRLRTYSHTLGLKARGAAVGAKRQSGVRVDPAMMAAFLVILAFVGVAAFVGPDPMVFVAAIGTLVLAYFAWGVYYIGRSHGFPKAHAIGLSSFFFGMALAGGLAVKLLLA